MGWPANQETNPQQTWPSPARRRTWSVVASTALPLSYPRVTVISPDVTFDTRADEEGVGVKFVVPSVMVPVATAARVKPTTIPFTSRPGALSRPPFPAHAHVLLLSPRFSPSPPSPEACSRDMMPTRSWYGTCHASDLKVHRLNLPDREKGGAETQEERRWLAGKDMTVPRRSQIPFEQPETNRTMKRTFGGRC